MIAGNKISFKQILYFQTVAECGSLRQGAQKLSLTQPTLSAQLGILEVELGVTLFERSRQGVILTVQGRELLPEAKQILDSMRDFSTKAQFLNQQGSGTYKLGVTPTLGPYLLPNILSDLHQRYNDLKLYVREQSPSLLLDDVLQGQHDLILTTQPVMSDNLTIFSLFREHVYLAMPHDHRLAKTSPITHTDLVGENVLTLSDNHLYHRQVSDLCEQVGANILRDYEGTSLDTLRQMVVMGMGVAFLPALYIKSEIRDQSELRLCSVEGASLVRDHVLAWRKNSPQRHFFNTLGGQIREMIAANIVDPMVNT